LLGTRLRISMSLQNVKRARIVARQARFCDANEDALVRATEETIRAILAEVDASLAVARAPEPAAAPVEPQRTAPPPPPPVVKAPPPPPPKPAPLLTPAPPPERAEVIAPMPPLEPERPSRLSRRAWAYIAGGAGVALVAAGGGFDYMAWAAYQDQKDAVAARDSVAYDSAYSSGRSKAALANVFYGTGLAALGAGAWLWFGGPKEAQVAVLPTAGGAVLTLGGVLP
jgi:hypothetical protein